MKIFIAIMIVLFSVKLLWNIGRLVYENTLHEHEKVLCGVGIIVQHLIVGFAAYLLAC